MIEISMRRAVTPLVGAAMMALFTHAQVMADAPVVANGAEPTEGLVTPRLIEAWRAGGEDDDIIFGSVASVRTDADGNTILLDGQLAEAHVYAPDGTWLRTVGREGDGPGEVRRPNDMFVTADGTVCMLQGFPGRIVKLAPDGTPAGEATYAHGDAGQGQFTVLVRGLTHPAGMVLAGIRMQFSGPGLSKQVYFLSLCDPDGAEKTSYVSKEHAIDYNNFELAEDAMDFVWSRMAVGADGKVYAAPGRNDYDISVFDAAGELQRVVSREFEPLTRDGQQRKVARQVIEAVGANYPTPPRKITIEDTPAVIGGMWTDHDGNLWVHALGADDPRPAGTWTVLDVFDTEGVFTRQVAVSGTFDEREDGLFVQPDGRLIVVVGALDAFLNQQGVSNDDQESEQLPLEVICYDLEY